MPIATINPATAETLETFEPFTDEQIEERIARSEAAFAGYHAMDPDSRAKLLRSAADVLDDQLDELARTVTLEMGKPLAQARAEVQKCAKALRWYAAHARALLADERPTPEDIADTGARDAYVRLRPLGPVLAVMPWNFPLWQVIRFAAPALLAGNTALLKHASNVPRTALALEKVFDRAGFPVGAFQTLLVPSSAIEGVLRDPRVAAVTLTGSEGAGRAVAEIAGSEAKKSVLELGGSDPFLVLPSADVAKAAEVAVTARVQNNGQSCIAAKRFIVHEAVFDEFSRAFVEAMRALRVGDPMAEETKVGPLATESGLTEVEEQVADAREKGATVLCGGERPNGLGAGWYYSPTVVTDLTPETRMHTEEVFGPVASLYRVGSLDEAIALANDTRYGLSSNAWTQDAEEQRRLIAELRAGAVYLNGMTASHPALPFGGIKRSGYGRELAGHGLREFCNVTTVWVG
ncbi:NADP-dependent succinic semialdehyde dehydrogenase [Phaeacidiphilus oryzae]|uniref:NADP-dependent succinic semialdehyde dehydrogenase n=1 Tax=Phaeacidiphilus oryzae TaxID=348818 RepID=UPI00055F6A25|nr:NADP-dependent succinic semialdehyde dehydrogenase [Phaeacidiphilus oryzae]